MKERKKLKKQVMIVVFILTVFSILFVSITSAQQVVPAPIRSRINCNSLSFQQLDELGNSVIERVYREKAGLINYALSGGNPQVLRQFHVRIAKEFYCGQPSGMREALQSLRNIMPENPSQKITSGYRINSCQ